jgi:hypothetical protein
MNKQEAVKLLSLIKLSYPTAYRDIDRETANSTVVMWQMSFPDVPYPIMEQAFDHFRKVSKFPPTVAEMVDELRHIYYQATECALIHSGLGNQELADQYQLVMAYTSRYQDTNSLGGLNIGNLQGLLNGGESHAGTSGDRQGNADRLPYLDAGGLR